jgi:ribosomal-protein-alanine N-acetyltransferase
MAGWAHHETMEKTQEILNGFIEEDKTFAIVFRDNGKVIGSLGIEKYGREEALTEFEGYKGRELGFVLSKDYWNKGLATEAVGAVISYLFNSMNLDFLICGHYNFNTRSKRVQEKCGFKPYRKLKMDTRFGTTEDGTLRLLINKSKNIILNFSHPETLIYEKGD